MRDLAKSVFRAAGLSVRPLRQDGRHTLLGLAQRPVSVIVDVGANEGQFAGEMLQRFPAARVWCVEPLPGPFAVLARWAAGTGGRVEVVQCALGESAGTMRMHVHLDHTASSSLLEASEVCEDLYPETRRQDVVEVPIRRLDDLRLWERWPADGGDRILKLDVQGYEDRVLAGGGETLRHVHHVILEVSIDSLYRGQAGFPALVATLARAGFAYRGNIEQVAAPDGHVVYIDALFSAGHEPAGTED